jgi:hypothetical protein
VEHPSHATATPPPADTLEKLRQANARNQLEQVERDSDFSRRSGKILERYDALIKAWLIGSVLVPLLFLWMFGHELDGILLGAGTLMSVMTFASPVLISFVFVNEIVVSCVLDEAFQRELQSLRDKDRPSAADRLGLRYLWIVRLCRAAALIVPTVSLWMTAGVLDDAFGKSSAVLLVAIGVLAVCWFSVKHLLIKRVLRPRHDRERAVLYAQEDRDRAAKNAAK